MQKTYRAELIAGFGDPIDENPTGVVEEKAFAALGLNYRYLLVNLKQGELEDAVKGIRAFHMKGANFTIPHKVNVIQYLDSLSEAAQIIGAVNTVVNDNGHLFGDNTDGKGYMCALQEHDISPEGKHVTILGAGGAARAISVECALAGAKKITIANIVREQGEELVRQIKERTNADAEFIFWGDSPFRVPEDTDIFSNATSVGLYPNVDQMPNVNYDTIRPEMVVTDVIFNDPNSLFLQQARKRGAKTIDGLSMLVNQAALNFTLWTGKEAPIALMKQALAHEFGLPE